MRCRSPSSSEDDAQSLQDGLEERGTRASRRLRARAGAEQMAYVNGELVQRTTDAMALFLQEVRRYPLLTREEEVDLAQRIERGTSRQGAAGQLQPASGDRQRPQVPGPRLPLLDLIQEGILGLIRAVGEVRLPQGVQVLDLRDVLGPPGDPAGARQPRPDDPHPVHLGQRERQIEPRPARADARLGREPTNAEVAAAAELTIERGARDARRGPGGHEPRPAGGRGGGHVTGGAAAQRRSWARRGGRHPPARRRVAPGPGATARARARGRQAPLRHARQRAHAAGRNRAAAGNLPGRGPAAGAKALSELAPAASSRRCDPAA